MIIVGTQDFVLVECPQSCPHVADAIFFVTINIQQLNTYNLYRNGGALYCFLQCYVCVFCRAVIMPRRVSR